MFHGHLDYFQKPLLGGRPNTKPGDHGALNAHNRWFILINHAWGPARLESHWNSIWLRARSHMNSHYTWGSVTTLQDFGVVLGRPLDTFYRALTLSWSWLLACVWSGPKVCGCCLVCFSCSPTFTRWHLHNETCVALAIVQWSIYKNRIKNWTSLDLLWTSQVHVCWLLDWIHEVLPIVFTIECRVVVNIWRRSPIFLKHVSLWCLLFDPCQTKYQSNRMVQLRKQAT